ncbi:histone-fold-containing protein [Aspergillus granulosus]|uniref:DNA polymerase epsilon subunit D n=1 Tax=Aspergillus granulosus TaxID=176169 RepID=A0ABR4HR56_9EURO
MSSPSPVDPSESQPPSQSQPQSASVSGSTSGTVQATEQQLKARAEGVSIEDYLLPRSLTLRLAKSVLPPNTSVQKDAVLAIQKAATVFVSYLSSHANESTLKRTVTPADVLNALSELEFEGFRPRLEKELEKFTDLKAAKRKPRKSTDGGDQNGDGNAEGKGEKEAGGAEETVTKDAEVNPDVKEVVVRGAKRVKKGDGRNGTGGVGREDEDENEDDDMDEGEGEGEEHDADADATDDEEEEEDEDEDDEAGDRGDDDLDRVEDLDRDTRPRRMVDPDAGDDSDSDDENGPGSQLRGDLGLG